LNKSSSAFQHLITPDLKTAVSFFYPNSPEKAINEVRSALQIGLLGGFCSAISLFFSNNIAFSGIFVTGILFLLRLRYLPMKYRNECLKVERYAELLHGEIQLVNRTTGSVFDVLELIAAGNFGRLSSEAASAICSVNKGEPPEIALQNLSYASYPRSIQEIFSHASQIRNKSTILVYSSLPIQYSAFTEQIQTRLALFIALSAFSPLIILAAVLVRGFGTSVWVIGISLVICLGVNLLNQILLKSSISLFGEE